MSGGPSFFDALRDRYIVEREIGRGGMATVYLAHEVRHRRPVALKVLREDLGVELGAERFLREVETAARLQHPHILPVFDSGETAGRLWFTMPFVEGETLRGRLERSPVGVAEALRIAREAARALEHAHAHGVVHRDIKPENILLTRDGTTLVADFGIARSSEAGSDRLTTEGLVLGTPSYMSPEQATAAGEVDGRSDIYSLACVLYEMVAGRPPFTGTSPHAVMARHIAEPPPPLRPAGGRVPPALERAVLRAMAKAPADRFATAAEFATALERAAPAARAWAHPLPVAMGLLALAAAAAGAALLGRREAEGRLGAGGTVASGFNRKMAQLTTGAGVEEWPGWSPDGTRLAYVAEADGIRHLFVQTVPGGEERRVTRDAHDHIQPAWSPDGRRLVFVRAASDSGRLEPSDLNGWYSEDGEVWTVDLASGQERRLVSDAFGPAWSPDGRQLAFDAAWTGQRRIWISDSAGLVPRQVTSDSSPSAVHVGARWSPDGRRVVFRRIEKNDSDLLVADLAAETAVRLTDDPATDLDPAWSPDGRWIYFSSNRGGGINVWRLRVAPDGGPSGAPQQLTTGAGDDVSPVPSPDGRRLAFAVRGTNADLWQLPVSPATGAPTGPPAPVEATTRVESRGAWSPDGRTIASNSDRLGEMNLWLHDLASGADRQLTSGAGGDYQPRWSPDGRALTFFSGRGGSIDVWSVSVADGRLARLTDDPGMDTNPFVSPDGRSIAFMSDRGGDTDIWVMHADGTGQRRLSTGGAVGHFLCWTADSRGIVYREAGRQARTTRLAVADGAPSPLPGVAGGAHMSWNPAESLILDVRGHKALWVHPVDGAPARRVFEFDDPDVRIDYPVWSPDGRRVLFDRAAPQGGDLWLLDGIE